MNLYLFALNEQGKNAVTSLRGHVEPAEASLGRSEFGELCHECLGRCADEVADSLLRQLTTFTFFAYLYTSWKFKHGHIERRTSGAIQGEKQRE